MFNGSMQTPTQIFFDLKANLKHFSFSFYVEDRNKKLVKRPLKSNMMAYVGPDISGQSLENPFLLRMFYSIQQFIDPEADEKKKCKDYPYGGFSVYHECDEDFVLQTFYRIHNFDFLPFWVTKELEKVTRKRYFFKSNFQATVPGIDWSSSTFWVTLL